MSQVKLFQSQQIRSQWDQDAEQWLFSVIDVIQVLTASERPRKYWSDLKTKLKKEGSQLSDKIGQLKMMSPDGNKEVARQGGEVAGNARKDIESKTGTQIISQENIKSLTKNRTVDAE